MMDWLSKVIDCEFPRTSAAFVRRLLIILHCSSQGHRGHNAMIAQLNKVSQLSKSRVHPDRFLSRCPLCLHVKAGEFIPRPWSATFRSEHATKHYILIFFIWENLCKAFTSAVVVHAILDWRSRDWVAPASIVLASVNHTLLSYLEKNTARTVHWFTTSIPREGGDKFVKLPSSNAIERNYERTHDARTASCAREKQTLLSKTKHRGEKVVKFSDEVYVLRSHGDVNRLNWLLVTWVDPYMITEAHSRYFVVKDIISGQGYGIHASRLKGFADFDLEVSEELFDHVAAPGMIMEVKEIKKRRFSPMRHDYAWLVRWCGLEEIKDSWESFSSMSRDVSISWRDTSPLLLILG
ncbi:LOW QUALITY PROTEIN: hypothetical protein PHMEG_00025556 [Phytophthora megakarya]|uniref:Chromo domain-containing protein n=1 Tax=Phytophthora megakarya TaxID=4795 RepID=A0A225VDF0_9STRA|nr:LOW QUALITY PROTEIN: hypothetical protein PHMEG_00025556 [Phytophthora megakarya]